MTREELRQWTRRVAALAWSMGFQQWEMDDVLQVGYEAIVKAQRAFDPERGVGFWTYATWRIRGALSDFRALRCRRADTTEVDTDLVADGRHDDRDEVLAVQSAIDRLPPRHRRLISALLEADGNISRAAQIAGVSRLPFYPALNELRSILVQ